MTAETRFWWIRHAPAVGADGRLPGPADAPADLSDPRPFRALARLLPRGAVWIASPARRARDTAAAIRAAGLDLPGPAIEPALDEQDFGAWAGRRWAEIDAADFWEAPAHTAPPGGESFADLVARVRPAVARLAAAHPGRDLCLVAHAGTIRAALALALDLPPERALAFAVDCCAVTRLDLLGPSVWRIAQVNRPPDMPGWPADPASE